MTQQVDQDVVIVGAGFSGLRALIEARRRGLSARVLETAPDVGGTWHWNTYPGARTDSVSWAYCFSFDEQLLQEWDWADKFPDQPQVKAYLSHLADRYDLRRDITFDTRVQRAERDEPGNRWIVTTDSGGSTTARHLVLAVGVLSKAYEPPFPGREVFSGEQYLTSRWPQEGVEFSGKRVAVIGTGSTGIQIIPQVAQTAAHLTVLQRTPNYAVPTRNTPIDEPQRRGIKATYPAIWKQINEHVFGFPMNPAGRVMADVDEAERDRILERHWEIGGFSFLFESFDDVVTNPETNAVVSEFVRNKIRTIVEDARTAELLCPTDHPIGSKRPPLGSFYYETFNLPHVSLVDVGSNPIAAITERGIRLTDGSEHELDVIVYATGFDAATGAFTAIDVRGKDGTSLEETWRDGALTHLAVATSGFPNMFMLGGPGLPFGNFPPGAEQVISWVYDLIGHATDRSADQVEADPEAMDQWVRKLRDIVDATVVGQGEDAHTWFLGANVPGKAHVPVVYLGGVPNYVADLRKCADNGYAGFTLTRAAAPAQVD